MALRCLLVSLVASLGFELPSGQVVTSWKVMGRDWVSARTVDLSALQAEASGWLGWNDPTMQPRTATLPTPVVSLSADLAFDSVNEGMALAFADDNEATRLALVPARPAESIAPPSLDTLALAFPAPAAELTDEEGAETDESTVAAIGRLSSAVQLTRDAVQAWASLLQVAGTEAVSTR